MVKTLVLSILSTAPLMAVEPGRMFVLDVDTFRHHVDFFNGMVVDRGVLYAIRGDELTAARLDDPAFTLQVIALDAKIQVDFNPDVVAYYRLIGYENRDVADQDFRNDEVDAGEIGAGHSATALYAVMFRPNADGRIATVQLRWEDPDSHQVTEINGNFNTWDLDDSFENADPHYQLAVIVSQYAEALRNSPWAQGIYSSQLVEQAYRISSILSSDPDVIEFASLVSRANQIRALGN